MESPQAEYSQLLSEMSAAYGNSMYNWAGQNYNAISQLANTGIDSYLKAAGTQQQLASEEQQQYESTYLPENQQLANLASTYNSPSRVNTNMGAAETTAAQGAYSNWNNTKQQLQGYGVNPSSGMYGELLSAANTAAGASEAGAGNQARQNTEATGRALLGESTQLGATEPTNINASINTEYGGLSGAVNTSQSNVNTGANLYNTANKWYDTAGSVLKQAQVGNQSQQSSQQSSQGQNSSLGVSTSSGTSSGGGGGGGYGGGYGGKRGGLIRSGMRGGGLAVQPNTGRNAPNMHAPAGGGLARGGIPQPRMGAFHSNAPSIHESNVPQATGLPARAAKGGQMDHTMPTGHQGRPMPQHPFHINGLPDASTGGHIPYELSPSHGHTTDDVVANLNAGEFVIPRRVVHHMGNKFFYDVIAKSDKESGIHPQPVGPEPLKKGSGADKARDAAESQNFLNGGGI
jgi:hypothetical protein